MHLYMFIVLFVVKSHSISQTRDCHYKCLIILVIVLIYTTILVLLHKAMLYSNCCSFMNIPDIDHYKLCPIYDMNVHQHRSTAANTDVIK